MHGVIPEVVLMPIFRRISVEVLRLQARSLKSPQNNTIKPKEAMKHQLFIRKSNRTPAVCKQMDLKTIFLFLLMLLKNSKALLEMDSHI